MMTPVTIFPASDVPADTAPSLAGKRIGLLSASVSRLGGGVFEAVVAQAAMIRAAGGEAVIFGLADRHSDEDRARFTPSPVHHASVVGPAQIGYSGALVGQLMAADLDLLHLHGIWMYPSRAGAVWARQTGRPYLISPHGMLDPWIVARGRGKKTIARIGYERASWRAARALHALTAREAGDIARETGRHDSIVVPNAGPAPDSFNPADNRPPAFLYLGRIHPKKNIGSLLEAWAAQSETVRATKATLTIAGWGEQAHLDELQAQLANAPASVRFLGPLFGEAKAAAYAGSRFFVLPSHSEGLPMVVLEAWAAGTPVLMTQECNLPEGFAAGASIDCGYDAKTIGLAIDRALAMTGDEWSTMARAARGLAAGPFSPPVVEACWAKTYYSMIQGGSAIAAESA